MAKKKKETATTAPATMASHQSYRLDADDMHDFNHWTPQQFAEFLKKAHLGDYSEVVIKHRISGRLAPLLTDQDLKDMGIFIVGDRLRIKAVIQALGRQVRYDTRTKVLWEGVEKLYFSDAEQCCCTCGGFCPDGT